MATLVLLGSAPGAPAARDDDPPLPWEGGLMVETLLERYAGQLASVAVGRPVTVVCNGANEWSQLASQHRFDPTEVWGFVAFKYDVSTDSSGPSDAMQLSQPACWYLDKYWRAPSAKKGKLCYVEARQTFRQQIRTVKVTKRLKVAGTWRKRVAYMTRRTRVPVETPKWKTCPDHMNSAVALQTISHETQHLFGIRDEATAECNGMQKLPWFAEHFGATHAQAREMAGDYYHGIYEVDRPGTAYYQPNCPNPETE